MSLVSSAIIPTQELSILQPGVNLADKNWFRTGGDALYFAEPKTAEDFTMVLQTAQTYDLSVGLLGEGANMLISDEGFNGVLIRPSLTEISAHPFDNDQVLVTAGAGVSCEQLIRWCLDHHIVGLEEFSGIPGSIGGAVFINIHYFEFLLSNFMVKGQIIEKATGKVSTVDTTWFQFGYNTSSLHGGTHYLVSATFKLKKVSPEEAWYARGRSEEIIRHRAKKYPTAGTCGSFFRNFTSEEVAHTSKKLIFVAYYLDKLGIKGELSSGDAIISYQHANMIVNRGKATTQDIVTLARTMQEMVLAEFGILPQPECRFVGFKEYPLLRL